MTENNSKVAKTPEGRMQYPNLLEARKNDLNGRMEFGVVLIFDQNADMNDLKRVITNVAKEKWGDKLPEGFRSPLRQGNVDRVGKDEYVDKVFINVKTQYKPGIVNHNVEPIMDPTEIYSGCYGKATVTAYAYDKMGNRGVSLSLQNIQKTRDGEPITGSRITAEAEFEPIAGANSSDEGFLV